MSTVAVTVYQGLAGDHNVRAIAGARAMGLALETRFGVSPTVVGDVTPILDTHWDIELDAARGDLRLLAAALEAVAAAGHRPVTALTRCAAALATLPVIARHHPQACVVWFDAHADLNTPLTTPSGYLGGMALAGAAGLWHAGLGTAHDLSHVVLVGTREIDPSEQEVIDTHHVQIVKADANVAEALRTAIDGRPTYVHLDCDVLNPDLVPTDYVAEDGLTVEQLGAACAVIAEGEVMGLEIAEFEHAWHDGGTPVSPGLIIDAIEPLLARLARP